MVTRASFLWARPLSTVWGPIPRPIYVPFLKLNIASFYSSAVNKRLVRRSHRMSDRTSDTRIPFIPVLLISGLSAGLIGCLIGLPILRLRDDFLAIATLGFGILVRVLLDNSDRFIEVLGGSRGFVGLSRITNLELTLFTTAFLILITRNLIFSKYGLFWQCIKDDELASTVFGIDTTRMKLLAFSFGCFLSGVAGSLYAQLYTFLHPSNFDFLKSIDFLIIVIIGGMGSITGTILCRSDLGRIYRRITNHPARPDAGFALGHHPHFPYPADDVETLWPHCPEGIPSSGDR